MDLSESKRRKLGTGFWGAEVPLAPYSRGQGAPFSRDIYYPCFPLNIYDNTMAAGNLSPVWDWEWGKTFTACSCKLQTDMHRFRVCFPWFPSESVAGHMLCQRQFKEKCSGKREVHTHLSEPWLWVTAVERSGMHPPVNLVHGNAAYRTGSAPAEFSSSWQRQQPYIILAINGSNPCKCSTVFFCFFFFFLLTPFRNYI